MSNLTTQKELNLIDMKKGISEAGGLFYQYRPCRRNASTIYDIDNIRHDVVYAQTPLNMNDPFDSMMGFSVEKIYDNCISMLTEALDIDSNTKIIVSALLKYKAFGKLAELILHLNELKHFLTTRRTIMHQTNLPFESFILQNAKTLYSKVPKSLKKELVYNAFVAFSILICNLEKVDISEENISAFLKMDELLEELHRIAEEACDTIYVPQLEKLLSTLTVSCFSASGWDNQLMWSHYANSYSGICVEYDFNRVDDFIGFIYPVSYTANRPTLSMQDLGISGFNLSGENKIIYGEINMKQIFSYLLSKNSCWSYEDEWRIVNIGEENTPLFIDLPCIKSITFGLNLDGLCKRFLLDVCKEKNIACCELVLNKEKFECDRIEIDLDEALNDTSKDADYITILSQQSEEIGSRMASLGQAFNEDAFDAVAFKNMLKEAEDFLCNAYFLKTSLNRLFENSDVDLTEYEPTNGIVQGINGINSFVKMVVSSISVYENASLELNMNGLLTHIDYRTVNRHISNIKELVEKISSFSWNKAFLKNGKNDAQVILHYDSLINENNDPVHDPKSLQEYMDKWDGQAFIDELKLSKDIRILEIGVGTGRLAIKVAAICGSFTGIDMSLKTVELAGKNLSDFPNVTLICDNFLTYEFDQRFDVIYSSLTFMHITDKLTAVVKIANLLVSGGTLVISIDKNQNESIECGSRNVPIYPDNPESFCGYISAAQLKLEKQFETEFANVFVAVKE